MSAAATRRALFALLRHVEEQTLTGVVRLQTPDGRALGQLMVAHGRLCFAAPAEGQTPIGKLLARHDQEFQRRLDAIALDARGRNMRLCEALLSQGTLDLGALRAGLRGQTARALLAMATGAESLERRFSAARDDYDHQLTFSALDMFTAASSLLDDAPEDMALRLFCEYAQDADAALLLLRASDPSGLPSPVAALGLEQASLLDAVTIARSAVAMAQPRLLPSPARAQVTCYAGPFGVWVVATGSERITLLRTGPGFEAGQMLGLALSLARRAQPPARASL